MSPVPACRRRLGFVVEVQAASSRAATDDVAAKILRVGSRDHEERVGQIAALGRTSRAPRRLRHRGSVGVDTDDELVGAGGRGRRHEPTVTGTQVDDRAREPHPKCRELPDVHLEDGVTRENAHARTLAHWFGELHGAKHLLCHLRKVDFVRGSSGT